ncbi:MAG: putative N-formylglutamate amidohydrolase [Planctomycetota bacterium]|jgi:predicted N-formylglutamate amidohydrolase
MTHSPATDYPAVSILNEAGSAQLLLVCEHASNFIPDRYDQLHLPAKTRQSHAAYDIGAFELACRISELLDASLISTTVSRLVYDCNRDFSSPGAIPDSSEIYQIDDNRDLPADEARYRYENFYLPLETAIKKRLAAYPDPPLLITIHSFTPVYHGEAREVDIGMICDQDEQLAKTLTLLAPDYCDLKVNFNDPYGPGKGVTHTLSLHGTSNGLPNTMIEVKNSLIDGSDTIEPIALMLSRLIAAAADNLGYQVSGG